MSYVIFVAVILFLAWCEMSKEIGDSLKVRKQELSILIDHDFSGEVSNVASL